MNNPTQPSPETVAVLILASGHEIRADLFEIVKSRIPELDPNRDYTLEEICGRNFWRSLSKGHRIKGGTTIAYLVMTGQLPLAFTTCPHEVPKRYRLEESPLHTSRPCPVITNPLQ